MAYVPVALMLAGVAAYTVLAGADFGAGLWTLLATGPDAARSRAAARHAMGPVWEANHVWLIFVLVVCWTAYPAAFGSIASTLAIPLTAAATGIIFRGAAYALRGQGGSRLAEAVLALSSVLTPFALGTVVGAIAVGRVPVGNAAGNLITSWLNVPAVLTGVLAVAFSGYLAAVYLAADSVRHASPGLAGLFRRRALAAGAVSGALALAGVLIVRRSGLDLTHGPALALVGASAAAGLATMALCWLARFALARLTAALAVASVVIGWAAAQAPRILPGMTVSQAAAGRTTLVAIIIAVACGAVVLIPSLALLYALFLRGHLDVPQDADAPPARTPQALAVPVVTQAAPWPGSARQPASRRVPAAIAMTGLSAGAGLLVFAGTAWAHGLGVASLVLCAVTTFRLANDRDRELALAREESPWGLAIPG